VIARRGAGWWFVSPALIAIAVCFAVPVIAALALSFTDFDIYGIADRHDVRFVGLDNYRRLLTAPVFWTALRNTVAFVVVGAPLSIAVSLATALLLHARLARARAVFRTALFAPVVTTVVAVAVIWRYLFHGRYGFLNYVLGWFGIDAIDWLGDPRWSIPALIVFAVWKNFGSNMIIFLAGLQSIPDEPYEAARIDGADRVQQLRFITLPALAPMMLLVTILTMVGYFQLFAEPYVMTRGGPAQSTVSVLYFMFEEGFQWWNLGFASAVAFVLFAIMLAGTLAQLALARRWSQP
jgi:multiple sugar transport system permease protein